MPSHNLLAELHEEVKRCGNEIDAAIHQPGEPRAVLTTLGISDWGRECKIVQTELSERTSLLMAAARVSDEDPDGAGVLATLAARARLADVRVALGQAEPANYDEVTA